MLTGSFASSYHGVPRATQDFDIVIAPSPQQLKVFVSLLPEGEYYVSADAALEAERLRSHFNVIDLATGWKIDLIILKSRTFSHEEFQRRIYVEFVGMSLAMTTVEDIIIAKLEWAKRGESQRQIDDVAGVIRIRSQVLDHEYPAKWVHELGLQDQWETAVCIANSIP